MSIVEAMTSVFTAIGEWITTTITSFTEVFYNAESGLTFLGTLTIVSLGIGLVMLLINVVKDFLQLRK